ncbi:hypothetical protein FZ103_13650 [Streptomonospora sp. PA3]|uniref:DUF6114 domain-containing protein n=1 Tax=Streptomonospora sp. PA3 TaxID=2607326 RepID=UPI0012DC3FCF|nr:DUF6114 domain-containing protein [Streptomonospora sp. PA3]MUL42212.1 hypothetical protein [Streptomonospora sp. PA3]
MTRHGASGVWQSARPAFRGWRRSRPFWGGLLITLAGIVIIAAPALNPLDLIVQQGIAGISGYFVGVLLMAVGVLVWLQPPQRFFYGIAAVLLSLISFVTSNFGGFVFGMLFGMVGGALAIAWVPDRARKTPVVPGRRGRGRRRGAPVPEEAGDEDAGERGTAPAAAHETGPAREIGDSAPDRGEDASDPDGDGASSPAVPKSGATYFTSEDAEPGGAAAPGQHRRADADRTGEDGAERGGTGGAQGGDRLHSLAAFAAALVLAVPAPATITWPWDDWFGGGEQETPAPDTPSSGPTPTPSPSASPGTGDGAGGGAQDDGQQEDDPAQEEDGEPETAAECTVQEGAASMSEEEYRALLEACRQAKEDGKRPEFEVQQGQQSDGRWLAHTEPSGLTADSLSMEGAAFEGVVEYPVKGGSVRYLKITMDRAELAGARQWTEHGGATTSLEIPEMTMSGDVVMHVTRMKVRILGIPLEFTPDFPPPLLLPSMTVTDLEADQPLAQAQTVTITGLDERVER